MGNKTYFLGFGFSRSFGAESLRGAGASALAAVLCSLLLLGTGCAFDLSYINQKPAVLDKSQTSRPPWTLRKAVTLNVGSGFGTHLKAGTRWTQVGTTGQGDVFATKDQIVTVEASNIYEAYVVLNGGKIVGFYLPVDRTFTAASPSMAIETDSQ